MANATDTIQQARQEVVGVLKRYGLGWRDIMPDFDAELWQEISPNARIIRKELFAQRYPKLYAKLKTRT